MSVSAIIAISTLLLASAPVEDRLATPVNRSTPDYPASCMPTGSKPTTPQRVTVVYSVTAKGATEGVRVRETTDACFNDTAVAAVRSWRFEPAKRNGVTVNQEDIETTFKFVVGETTASLDFDARPYKRFPPAYPERCMDKADRREIVVIEFDVTGEGDTANGRVIDSTNSCLNTPALNSVKNWKYRPKLEDGKPVERKAAQAVIVFELATGGSPPPNRLSVGRKLNAIGADIRSNRDPQEILADLAEIEARYGDDFTRTELKAFHQLRGSARLGAKDYRGALDDFRIVQKLGVSGETGEAIVKTIEQLEAYIAAEDAAAMKAPETSAPDEPAPGADDAPQED